ncbi:hypothetical protein [Bradyrhizobium pachyrhizi]|uniref:hypothetical protein n=1 Tax=Bradyrhizobium pachyrhizi TaxID=280333 RepID=UPI00067E3DF5|nr:hypothetical protein [Bradyrhizobium pachyrhizi]
MKVLAPAGRVVGYNIKAGTSGDGSESADAKVSTSHFHDIAIKDALRSRGAEKAADVSLVSSGRTQTETIRNDLVMAADLSSMAECKIDPLAVAHTPMGVFEVEQPSSSPSASRRTTKSKCWPRRLDGPARPSPPSTRLSARDCEVAREAGG